MSWIKVKSKDELDKSQQDLYKQLAGSDGQVDNVLQIHSLRPHTLEAHMMLYKAALHHNRNTLPVWLLECIGIYVSRLNRCDYCDRHHTAGLFRLIENADQAQAMDRALSKPLPGAPFNETQQAIFGYVRKLTVAPSEVEQSDVVQLQQAGYDDGEILEINQVTGYFAYANRSVLGLGVKASEPQLGMSPPNDDDIHNWGHH